MYITTGMVVKLTGKTRAKVEAWADAHKVARLGDGKHPPFVWTSADVARYQKTLGVQS